MDKTDVYRTAAKRRGPHLDLGVFKKMVRECFFAVPFIRCSDGQLASLEPICATDAEHARRRAFELAVRMGGAIAISRQRVSSDHTFGEVVVLATYGDADERAFTLEPVPAYMLPLLLDREV